MDVYSRLLFVHLLRQWGFRGLEHVVFGGGVREECEEPGPTPLRLPSLRYLVAVGARRPVLWW